MDDGSIVMCYKTLNILPFIILALVAIVVIAAACYYLLFMQKKDIVVNGAIIHESTGASDVAFNGIMEYNNDSIDIRYYCEDEDITVSVEGEGIQCEPVTVPAGTAMYDMPCHIVSAENVVNAKVHLTSDTSDVSYDVVIEVPENYENSNVEGLRGYFTNEEILNGN